MRIRAFQSSSGFLYRLHIGLFQSGHSRYAIIYCSSARCRRRRPGREDAGAAAGADGDAAALGRCALSLAGLHQRNLYDADAAMGPVSCMVHAQPRSSSCQLAARPFTYVRHLFGTDGPPRRGDATDLYHVSLAASPTSRPVALQTTVETTLVFDDLYPDRDYWLTLRSHPSTEPTEEVWGWRPAGAALRCRTATENTAAPHRLRRQGDTPHVSELRLQWRPALLGGGPAAQHSVGVRGHGPGPGLDSSWRWVAATAHTATILRGLPSGTGYEVVVRDDSSGAVSDPLRMRTAALDAMHTIAWRTFSRHITLRINSSICIFNAPFWWSIYDTRVLRTRYQRVHI